VKRSSTTTETSERGVGRWPRAGALFVVSGPASRVHLQHRHRRTAAHRRASPRATTRHPRGADLPNSAAGHMLGRARRRLDTPSLAVGGSSDGTAVHVDIPTAVTHAVMCGRVFLWSLFSVDDASSAGEVVSRVSDVADADGFAVGGGVDHLPVTDVEPDVVDLGVCAAVEDQVAGA